MIRSVVKHRYFKGKKAEKNLKRYINYLTYREEHGLKPEERIFFGATEEKVRPGDVTDFIGSSVHSVAGHELILSPGIQSVDRHRYTRELMSKLEKSLGVNLSWVAIEHKGIHNHIHVLIDGNSAGRRVRLGLEEYRRLREWGDHYLEREHQLERYLKKDVDLDSPFKHDSGDCLFESLFELPSIGTLEKQNHDSKQVDHFSEWDKAKAIAELSDDEKIYEGGKVYTKFSTYNELASLQNKLRVSGVLLPHAPRRHLKEWLTDKKEFGDDHHERLAREKYARIKGRAQSKKRLVSIGKQDKFVSSGVKNSMLQTNHNQYGNSVDEDVQSKHEIEQERLKEELALKQMAEDARLRQTREHEDKLWQANNRREEKFLEAMVAENPEFAEWANEARNLRAMQEQRRTEEREAYDREVERIRQEDERIRLEDERIRQEADERESQEAQEREDVASDERYRQEQREEDERLAQLQKEDEEWRRNEADAIAKREEENRHAMPVNSKSQFEDDRARVAEYVVDGDLKYQQREIEEQHREREYKVQNEQQTRQFQQDCRSSMDKRDGGSSDRGALRYERRPFRQRLNEDKGRQLQWHIRYQNSATRMMLNQQLEAEADATKKEQIRQQLDDLNKGEQEQLQTELEPVDLDAIAKEYLRPDVEEPDTRRGRFLDEEKGVDPERLAKQWQSPLDKAQTKAQSLEDVEGFKRGGQESVARSDTVSETMVQRESFSDRVDRYAEESWRQYQRNEIDRDELSGFLNIEGTPRMSRDRDMRGIERQAGESTGPMKQTPSIEKQRIRDDEIFGR